MEVAAGPATGYQLYRLFANGGKRTSSQGLGQTVGDLRLSLVGNVKHALGHGGGFPCIVVVSIYPRPYSGRLVASRTGRHIADVFGVYDEVRIIEQASLSGRHALLV